MHCTKQGGISYWGIVISRFLKKIKPFKFCRFLVKTDSAPQAWNIFAPMFSSSFFQKSNKNFRDLFIKTYAASSEVVAVMKESLMSQKSHHNM